MTRIVSIALAAMTAGAAMAADWYVDNAAPYGGNGQSWGTAYKDLQLALTAAAANDTIIVTNGNYSAITRTDNAKILIRSVNGPSVTTISGGVNSPSAWRCATLGSQEGDNNITLSGFTLSGGYLVSGENIGGQAIGGGVIYGTLTNCVVWYNRGSTFGGGAAYSTLIDCTITKNTSYEGAGAYCCTLINCLVTDNEATTFAGGTFEGTLINCVVTKNKTVGNGGGGGTMYGTLENCIISENETGGYGGGVYGGTLKNCLITRNTGYNYGGGVYGNGTVLINCTVWGNTLTATSGSGAGVSGGTVLNSIVWGNTMNGGTLANWSAGGCAITNSCTMPMPSSYYGADNITDDPMFVNATAGDFRLRLTSPCINMGNNAHTDSATDLDGNPRVVGGVVDMGAYEFTSGLVCVDHAAGNDSNLGRNWVTPKKTLQNAVLNASAGWIVAVKDGTYAPFTRTDNAKILVQSLNGPAATLINGGGTNRCATMGTQASHVSLTLSGFTLTNGAAINDSTADGIKGGGAICGTLTNCVLTRNRADGWGGGAHMSVLTGCTLTGNSGVSYGGGSDTCDLTNCTLSGNTVTNAAGIARGGGAWGGTLVNCTLTGNAADLGGGAYQSTLNTCTLTNNTATSDGGGTHQGTLNNCTLANNTAASGGGAFNATLTTCTLRSNTAIEGGGAHGGTLVNCVLTRNTATSNGGGACGSLLLGCLLTINRVTNGTGSHGGGASDCTLINCTVAGNLRGASRSTHAGVYYCTVANSIVWGNDYSGQPDNWNKDSSFTYSCTTPFYKDTGNIEDDPMFVNVTREDFRLQYGSLCIDAGRNQLLSLYPMAPTDLDGTFRIVGPAVDMGAYEFTKDWVGPPDVPVIVPFSWLNGYRSWFGIQDYVALALAQGENNVPLWESYVAGLIPTNPSSKFLITNFVVNAQSVTALDWAPRRLDRIYTVYGKTNLTDTTPWYTPTNSGTRFFKVEVRLE